MRGKKRPYGRFNVQSENARGQIRYETPMQQLQFLQQKIVRQETIKALFYQKQRQQEQEALNASNQSNSQIIVPAMNPFSWNLDGANQASQKLPILGSSLIEDQNQVRPQQSQEQQISEQYSQMIQNTQQRIENLNLDVSFTSNFDDLASFPLRAQGRKIFLRSQAKKKIKKNQLELQAQFMKDKFQKKDNNQMIILKEGPNFEEIFSEFSRQQAEQQIIQQRGQFYSQNTQALSGMRQQLSAQVKHPSNGSEYSDILSIRSSQQSQISSNEHRALFPALFAEPAAILPQSQESIQDQQLEELQLAVQPIKKYEKKERRLQSIHQKFSSKYKHYTQAVQLNPEIASFNRKELVKHFKQPWIKYQSRLEVIQMRFGSCDPAQIDFQQTQATLQEISNKLGLKYQSVATIIRNFRLQRRLITKRSVTHNISKMRKFNIAYILEPQTLIEWAPFSLEKRCQLIQQRSNLKISRVTLANYYKKHNIKYRKPQYTIHSSRNEEELKQDRRIYITTIVDYYHRNLEIIYIDECSTHLWEKKNRLWVPKNGSVSIKLPSSRKESVTVIGAISSKSDKLYYCFCNSTNQDDVFFFFEGLNSENSDLRLNGKVVVLDNHSAHITKDVRDYIQRQGATILFLPVASSYFNPIETMWSWIKAKWRQKLVEPRDFDPDKSYLLRELQKICDTVPPHVVRHISAHCYKTLKSYIEENLMN